MSAISPLLTFKAGICDVDVSVPRSTMLTRPSRDSRLRVQLANITTIRARPSLTRLQRDRSPATSTSTPKMVCRTLHHAHCNCLRSTDLIHFCWRERNVPLDQPELDLVMVPTDGHFVPYESSKQDTPAAKTNGRVFVLKFMSSSQRHMFWLQSKPQGRNGDPAWFSPRDLKIGQIVDALLQGEEVDVQHELSSVANTDSDERRRDNDDDEAMEDVEGHGDRNEPHSGGGAGGAGPGATGGDVREEGEGAREGGGDGARA
jgi:hypothetical protein